MDDRDEIEQFLTPERRAFLLDCIRAGLADYANDSNYSTGARVIHHPSLRAHIRNAHIVDRANKWIAERPDLNIKVKKVRGRYFFVIADRLWVSFKKLDMNRKARGIPTRQAVGFMGQQPLWPVEDIPATTNVFAGYIAYDAETSFELWLTCPDGRRNTWELKLSGAEIIDLFPAKTSEATNVQVDELTARRVRIRWDESKKEGTDAADEQGNQIG
ncbi:MAG TPA: hypothetical protein VJ183_17645 [Chloroflexia bacterium]|nr:hypothetical protein [Chloroflexia bacterium]